MLDLWTSRRDTFNKCEYWSQSVYGPEYESMSKIAYNSTPTGTFMAKESNSYNTRNQIIGDSFMIEENSIVLETRDDISDLKRNDIVRYDDKIYRVDDIQKSPKKNQRQYIREGYSCTYFISLRG